MQNYQIRESQKSNQSCLDIIFFSTYGLPKVEVASNRIFGLTKALSQMSNNVYLVTYRYKKYPYTDENSFDHCKNLSIVPHSTVLTFFFNLLRIVYKKFKRNDFNLDKGIKRRGENKFLSILRGYFLTLGYYVPFDGFISTNNVVKYIKNNINLIDSSVIVLITSYPPVICNKVGIKLKEKFGSKIFWVADYRDLMEDNPYLNIETPSKFKKINTLTLQNADLITTVSEGLKSFLIKQACRHKIEIYKKITVIYNGFGYLKENSSLSYYYNKSNSNKIKIVYTGALYGGRHNIEPLFRAISRIEEDMRQKFKIFYAGLEENIFLKGAKKFELSYIVESLGFVKKSEALNLQENASILLLIKSNEDDEGILTGKFFEYLRLRKPILVLGDKDKEFNVLAKKIGGIKIFGYDQVEGLAIFLQNCVENNDNLIKLFGRFNNEEIEKFTWKRLSKKLIKKINFLI